MLEELMKLLQENGNESVINNPQIPNEHNEGVLNSAKNSIMDTIQSMIANGQANEVAQLANPQNASAQQMQQGFVKNIMDQFGIQGETANQIASQLIPSVLSQLTQNGQGINLNSITSLLGGAGLDKDKDGDVDLNDLKKFIGL